jgi:GDSL-like lipase/acylhydrolase family protein
MLSFGSASRIPHLLRSVGVCALIIVATLAVTEILLRVADFRELRQDASERSLAYGYDSELGWVPRPGSVSTVTTERTIHARHNALGFRDIEFKPDGRPVMLFLGDSFVWGVDAEAGERFTDILRGKLPEFQTVNAGVSGYGTDQEYLWLRRIWPSVRPSVVVLLFCTDNDRLDNSSNLRYGRYRKPYFVTGADGALLVRGQPVPGSLQRMIRESWLVRHLWIARVAALAYAEMSSPPISLPDLTERLITEIHDFVSAHDAKLLVALQSTDDRMVAHLKSERIPFVTLDGAAAFDIDHGHHFTPEGHAFAARRMLDLFDSSLRVAQDQPRPAKRRAAKRTVGAAR